MKKTLLKILGTFFAIVAFYVAQYHIRQYYGIDPRFWFFVVFGLSMVGYIIVMVAFCSEIQNIDKYFKTHSFFDFIIEKVAPAIHKVSTQIRPTTEKVVNSFLYKLISFITCIASFTGVTYKLFFMEDFLARTTVYIIFLVMIACTALSRIIKATVIEEEKRKSELIYGGMWGLVFILNLVEFVCI